MPPSTLQVNDFTTGWICVILSEYVVACQLFDEEYCDAPHDLPKHDDNFYTYGRIGAHHVVITCLPAGWYGLVPAASVSRDMRRSFPALRFVMMVGIGGSPPSKRHDIRLGDVDVSEPFRRTGGVIQYDHGKTIQNRMFEPTGSLNKPPAIVLNAMQKLSARHMGRGHTIAQTINDMICRNTLLARLFQKPDSNTDILYKSNFVHMDHHQPCSTRCATHIEQIVRQRRRESAEDDPSIHYGLITSADPLM